MVIFMETETRIHQFQLDPNSEPISQELTFDRVFKPDMLVQIHAILSPEFSSRGGNIRDIPLSGLTDLTSGPGEVWAAFQNCIPVACLTITPLEGSTGIWWYLNHGVIIPGLRYQGGQIMENLVRTCISTPRKDTRYVVITVAPGHILRAGFSEIDPLTLSETDPDLAYIVTQKLRPDKPAHVCVAFFHTGGCL